MILYEKWFGFFFIFIFLLVFVLMNGFFIFIFRYNMDKIVVYYDYVRKFKDKNCVLYICKVMCIFI